MPIRSVSFPINHPKKPHVIDDISFSKDFIVCSCAWKGTVAEFRDHRKEAMAALKEQAS